MQFRILFTVIISHTYYRQGCKDFSFIIPADSAQLLKNGKLITKNRDGELHILWDTDEISKPQLIGKTLRIGLKLLNPFFSNFTDLDFNFNSSFPIYRNSTHSDALDTALAVTLVGKVFSHELKIKARPLTVILKNTIGQVLQTDTITENDRSTISYDLKNQTAGLYTVEESNSGNKETTNYYFDLELQRQGVFGVIEIAIADHLYTIKPPHTPPPQFAIAFTAKQETLKYYVVAKNYDLSQLSIADAGFTDEGRSPINFTKVLSTAFTEQDISPTLLGNGEAQIALFKSQTAVTRQEQARQKIQLQKNGEVLIRHLPQPSAEKSNSDLIVQLAKPKS
jgi:hypothetical protein